MAAAPPSRSSDSPAKRAGSSPVVYDHVVFDLDGTLVDSRADLVRAVNHVLATLGLPPRPAEVLAGYVGEGARVLVAKALAGAPPARVEQGLATFMEWYGAHLLDATRPYPGIVEVLAALAARGVVLSVLTNKPVGMSRAILEGLGLSSSFLDVVGGDSLPTRKPDPAGLDHLRARSGAARERTLLVGDSSIDLRTARAGGVAFCGVAWGLSPAALARARPERIVTHPGELLAVVEGR